MNPGNSSQRIASLFSGRWNRNYVASKLRTDPVYEALAAQLKDSPFPLLDIGCGLGLLAFFLRTRGIEVPVLGIDYDEKKIADASLAASQFGVTHVEFRHADVRLGLPNHLGNVSILDILQFFTADEQEILLTSACSRVLPGGRLIIRSGLRDSSARFTITVLGDLIAKATLWMKAAPTHYPTNKDLKRVLSPFGELTISPLWGKTPFNNHLIVLTKPLV